MNTSTAAYMALTEYYCAMCDTTLDMHICLDCNDYCITVDEATQAGLIYLCPATRSTPAVARSSSKHPSSQSQSYSPAPTH